MKEDGGDGSEKRRLLSESYDGESGPSLLRQIELGGVMETVTDDTATMTKRNDKSVLQSNSRVLQSNSNVDEEKDKLLVGYTLQFSEVAS